MTSARGVTLAAVTAAVLLTGCASTAGESAAPPPQASVNSGGSGPAKPSASSPGASSPASSPAAKSRVAMPSSHVHAVARDPGDGALLLATHEGLIRHDASGATQVGPAVDYMGFTVVGPGHYLASGHPNAVRELPQPMGLIESTDGGRTWKVLSRGGESDFHAMVAAGDTVVGFDGRLRTTVDRKNWTTGELADPPRTLSSSPDGNAVLATTARGVMRSDDRGSTWSRVEGAPTLLLVTWADASTVVGVAPDGAVAISRDAARTWELTGAKVPPVQALGASSVGSGLEILVVTETEVLASSDGKSFGPVAH